MKHLERCCEFFVLLARNFEFTKTPHESFLAVYDRCLAYSTRFHTPHQEHASTLQAAVACSYPQGNCNRLVGGCFFCLMLCTLNFDQFRPLQHLKVEV